MAKRPSWARARKGVLTRATAIGFIRRGLLGDGRWRLNVGLFLLAVGTLRRWTQRDEELVHIERLQPGERVLITALPKDAS